MKIIKIETCGEINELSEIDFDLYEEQLGEKYWNEEGEYDIEYKGNIIPDGFPINIQRLIDYLQQLQKDNCNYVSIQHYVDHIGYIFQGLKVSIHEKV